MRHANPTRGRNRPAFAFKRDRLPEPADYYREQGLKLTGGGAWKSAVCPYHNDTKPSLRVRIVRIPVQRDQPIRLNVTGVSGERDRLIRLNVTDFD